MSRLGDWFRSTFNRAADDEALTAPSASVVMLLAEGGAGASSVNVWMTNWTDTGTTVPCSKFTVDWHAEWLNAAGEAKSKTATLTFPNDLQLVPASWLKEELQDLVLRAARKRFGVDD